MRSDRLVFRILEKLQTASRERSFDDLAKGNEISGDRIEHHRLNIYLFLKKRYLHHKRKGDRDDHHNRTVKRLP